MALARQRGIKVGERHIQPGGLGKADEVFLKGSAAEVTPVGEFIGTVGHLPLHAGYDLPADVGEFRPAGRAEVAATAA